MLQKMILENQRLRQEIEMLRGHGVDKREVGLLQLCGGMGSSVSGKVAQSEKGTDATPSVGGGMLSGSGQPPIPYGGGSELTGGGQPEAGNLFGPSGQQRESVSLSNEVAAITSGKVAVSSGPSYECFQRIGWGEGEPWGTQAILRGGILGCTSGDKTASVALSSWGVGKKMMGGGQQEAGSLLSSVWWWSLGSLLWSTSWCWTKRSTALWRMWRCRNCSNDVYGDGWRTARSW